MEMRLCESSSVSAYIDGVICATFAFGDLISDI